MRCAQCVLRGEMIDDGAASGKVKSQGASNTCTATTPSREETSDSLTKPKKTKVKFIRERPN